MLGSRYSASRQGLDKPPRTAVVIDDEDELYKGFNDVSPALDTRSLREDQAFQQTIRTPGIGRQMTSRLNTGMFRLGTVSVRGGSRAGTASARPVTAVRAAGYTSTRDAPARDDKKEDSIEDKIRQMEAKIMTLVEESCVLSARPNSDDETDTQREQNMSQALAKAQEASTLERQLIRMQEQANLGDSHNLDLTFAVLCNLADQYALNEMYTEALNTYQLLTRNKVFPHANRLKVNMGNIYFKMGEHPKALKLYRMALDQTPTAEKDLRMKVMHNIGLLLVRMGKFRDAVTNFQHIMHEQGDFQTGLHLVLCSVALDDAEGGKAAFHAMLDVEPPTYHHDIAIDDENDAYECVVRDVVRGDRLSRWSRVAAAHAERCLALAAAALMRPLARSHRDDDAGSASWCVEALRGYSGGGAGSRLELGSALAALRSAAGATGSSGSGSTGAIAAGSRALQRLKAVARAHPNDRVLRAEANTDAAFVAYALGKFSEAHALSEAASRDDPYSCAARVCSVLSELAAARLASPASPASPSATTDSNAARAAATNLVAATHLDPTDLIAMHNSALALELSGEVEGAQARWQRVRNSTDAGATLRALAAAGLARAARAHAGRGDLAAEHWYSIIGNWDVGVSCALAELHSEMGDTQTAKHHYQDVEAAWASAAALRWLAADAAPEPALRLARRAARLQPASVGETLIKVGGKRYCFYGSLQPEWGLLMGSCLRASGRYQEALAVYKKLNAKFPDNIQCLKLIVKLCGDQGLAETSAWSRELQRRKTQERVHVASADSASSRASHSPVLQTQPQGAARAEGGAARRARTNINESFSQESMQPLTRSLTRTDSKKKTLEDFDDDLPLPPE